MATTVGPESPVEMADLLAQLVESRRQLRAVLDNLPAMIAYWDRDLRNVLGNRAYVEWFGWTPEQMVGHHIREVIGEDLYAKNTPYLQAALHGEEQHFDRTIVDASGETRYSQASYIPDVDEHGNVRGIFVLVADVTARVKAERELAAAKDELEHLALTDGLTGLGNRRALERIANGALALLSRAEAGTRLLALLAIDLDDFKPVNDQYGHAAGDELLVALGQRLNSEMRAPDLAARIGGDELVVVALEPSSREAAEHLAERIRLRIAEPVALSCGATVSVTASIGLALAGGGGPLPTLDDLLRLADARMYEAKAAGGDCWR